MDAKIEEKKENYKKTYNDLIDCIPQMLRDFFKIEVENKYPDDSWKEDYISVLKKGVKNPKVSNSYQSSYDKYLKANNVDVSQMDVSIICALVLYAEADIGCNQFSFCGEDKNLINVFHSLRKDKNEYKSHDGEFNIEDARIDFGIMRRHCEDFVNIYSKFVNRSADKTYKEAVKSFEEKYKTKLDNLKNDEKRKYIEYLTFDEKNMDDEFETIYMTTDDIEDSELSDIGRRIFDEILCAENACNLMLVGSKENKEEAEKIAKKTIGALKNKNICEYLSLFPYGNNKHIRPKDFSTYVEKAIGGGLIIDCHTRDNNLDSYNSLCNILDDIQIREVLEKDVCLIWLCTESVQGLIDMYVSQTNCPQLYDKDYTIREYVGKQNLKIILSEELYAQQEISDKLIRQATVKIEALFNNKIVQGTGTIITKSGEILTCYHCVADNDEKIIPNITASLWDDDKDKMVKFSCSLEDFDIEKDLAILRLQENINPYPCIPLLEKEKISEISDGSEVYIVNYKNEIKAGFSKTSIRSIYKNGTFSIDAEYTEGNSGSPILSNDKKRVIGIYFKNLNEETNNDAEGNALSLERFWKWKGGKIYLPKRTISNLESDEESFLDIIDNIKIGIGLNEYKWNAERKVFEYKNKILYFPCEDIKKMKKTDVLWFDPFISHFEGEGTVKIPLVLIDGEKRHTKYVDGNLPRECGDYWRIGLRKENTDEISLYIGDETHFEKTIINVRNIFTNSNNKKIQL